MCCPVNMYCDRDISIIVIVTYHVLINAQLVSYAVSIQCNLSRVHTTKLAQARPRPGLGSAQVYVVSTLQGQIATWVETWAEPKIQRELLHEM